VDDGRQRADIERRTAVIDKLRAPRVQAPLADLNDRVTGTTLNFGVRTSGMRIASVVPGTNAANLGCCLAIWCRA
jgi:hypothetical protein